MTNKKRKKGISILTIIVLVINMIIPIWDNVVLANSETEKKNPDSYWNTENAPLFYGATKITIKKGLIDSFNVLDTRFRIFAKDFEDGDLTQEITYSGEVDVNEVGTYEITYKVKDSHGNETSLTVPVIITDDENAKINVERTLYTIPSVWNMDLVGFSRCNYGDRQILGIFLPAGKSIRARILSSDNNISVQYITNDSAKEISQTLSTNGEWITLQNTKDGVDYASVPLFTSTVLSKKNTDLNKVLKIELEYDETIPALDYYHEQDDEESFRNQWQNNQNEYGVIENEVLTVVVPKADLNKTTNYYRNGFQTLDQFLEYYQKVVDKMDEYVGLDLNPTNLTDQNVRTKYLVRANAHGAGSAYYSGNHVGINSTSVAAFFEMNWGGLHELAHGYQGSLGKGDMQLGEVANNIIGHYIQIDKSIYFHSGDWLGNLSQIEESKNQGRLEGQTFTSVDVTTRLYMIVNLLDYFEGSTTYAKMFQWYREEINKGRSMTNQDAYVESIADIYHINIIPYMEAWGLTISDSVKEKVYSANYPLVNILKDITKEETLNDIMIGEQITEKYSLVTNDILNQYDATGNLTLKIDIDDIEKLSGKNLLIKQGNKTIKTVKITSNQITINNLPVGTYYLQMPVHSDYTQSHRYITIKEGENNTYTYQYERLESKDYNNYLSLKLQGIYGTFGYELTFKDNYTKGIIHLNGANMGSGADIYVKISDDEGNIISEETVTGIYFDYNKADYEVELKPGYIIEVKYPNYSRVKVYSTLSGKEVTEYRGSATITKYFITENGLQREDMDENTVQELAYSQLREYLTNLIDQYKANVTEEELNNKLINFQEKAEVLSAYNYLRQEDQQQYTEMITKIKQGGVPIITTIGNLEYEIGEDINLYSLIQVIDNEDGIIEISTENTKIETNLDSNQAGAYTVKYQVFDSDNNQSSNTLQIKILATNPSQTESPEPTESPKPAESPEPAEKPIPTQEPTPTQNNNFSNTNHNSNTSKNEENYENNEQETEEETVTENQETAEDTTSTSSKKQETSKFDYKLVLLIVILIIGIIIIII